MKELYRSGTLHIAKLDERNYVVYDSKTLKIKKGDSDYESYDYKYYPKLENAVIELARRGGGSDIKEWLDRFERAIHLACDVLGGE